jgi:hypothetical protein
MEMTLHMQQGVHWSLPRTTFPQSQLLFQYHTTVPDPENSNCASQDVTSGHIIAPINLNSVFHKLGGFSQIYGFIVFVSVAGMYCILEEEKKRKRRRK